MILRSIQRVAFLRRLFNPALNNWFQSKTKTFIHLLQPESSVIDLGCGNCFVAKDLISKGFYLKPVDVKNLSVFKEIQPVIYDGIELPFLENQFNYVLLLTILHHTESPEQIIQEAKRVGNELIIIEDTYNNKLHKWITQGMDTLVNLGHSKMTYQNKSEKEWETIFTKNQLQIKSKLTKRKLVFFQQTTYQLCKSNN